MSAIVYGSVCSGIEAATVAWETFGWRPAFFAEIEKFPSALLRHHYPDVPNAGDFTQIRGDEYGAIDVLVGGTPCQAFSVAGLRAGLADARGNLTLEFLRLAGRIRPRWLVWENVPGVFSATSDDAPDHGGDGDGCWEDDTNEAHAFSCFLAGLQELGYGFAYRVLDAQYFGVPQRRRRVFVVGHSGGEWQRAAAVLFESHSLSGNTAPRRKTGQTAPTIPARSLGGGGLGTDFDCDGGLVAGTMMSNSGGAGWSNSADHAAAGYMVPVCMATGQGSAEIGIGIGTTLNCNHEAPIVTHALRGEGFDASEDGTGRGTPLTVCSIQAGSLRENPESGPDGVGVRTDGVAYTLEARAEVQAVSYAVRTAQTSANGHGVAVDQAHTLDGANGQAVAISANQRGEVRERPVHGSLSSSKSAKQFDGVMQGMAVRRLTPMECERLQGFPDGYTKISPKTADGPRYKALGNSMAVPVMRWIGERIAAVNAM